MLLGARSVLARQRVPQYCRDRSTAAEIRKTVFGCHSDEPRTTVVPRARCTLRVLGSVATRMTYPLGNACPPTRGVHQLQRANAPQWRVHDGHRVHAPRTIAGLFETIRPIPRTTRYAVSNHRKKWVICTKLNELYPWTYCASTVQRRDQRFRGSDDDVILGPYEHLGIRC